MNEFLQRIVDNHHEYLNELYKDVPAKLRYLKHRLSLLTMYRDYLITKTDDEIKELELFDYKYLGMHDDIVFLIDSYLFTSASAVGIERRRKEVNDLIKEVEEFLARTK